jgi:hypothetical protein
MPETRTVTVDQLIAQYAEPIATAVGLDHAEYDRTADGLARLLLDTADRLSSMDQTGDWLEEAATDLAAVARLGDDGAKTHKLLESIDANLYEAKAELELC